MLCAKYQQADRGMVSEKNVTDDFVTPTMQDDVRRWVVIHICRAKSRRHNKIKFIGHDVYK